MPASKANQKAVNKYIKNNYDRFTMHFKKGEKDKYRDFAEKQGKSLNSFIIELLQEAYISSEKAKGNIDYLKKLDRAVKQNETDKCVKQELVET